MNAIEMPKQGIDIFQHWQLMTHPRTGTLPCIDIMQRMVKRIEKAKQGKWFHTGRGG